MPNTDEETSLSEVSAGLGIIDDDVAEILEDTGDDLCEETVDSPKEDK